MTTRKALLATLAVIAMVAAAYWFLVPREKEVLTLTVKVARAERILAVNGRIRPRLQVDIRPSVGGELIALPFDVGDRVENGQVIARIDDAPELAAVAEAEASVRTQEATLAQARRDLRRFEALGQFATKRDVEARRLAVVEGERVNTIVRLGERQRAFVEACTPGYYNNEGVLDDKAASNALYGDGPVAFIKLLEDWRNSGKLPGLASRSG